ncbi:hypothetical protein CPLU01_12557, partial [Colletotrichum plurivorum]
GPSRKPAVRPRWTSQTPPLQSSLSTQLLPELVARVLYHADPADHLNFALTCKRLADCSQYALRRHRDAYAKYGLCSDISPETVPALLRLVTRDPIVAWHIRSFEVWGARRSWANWKHFGYMHRRNRYQINPEDHEWNYGGYEPPVEDTEDGERAFDISTWDERVDHYFKRHELEGLMSYMQEAIGFSPSQAARAWEEIQQVVVVVVFNAMAAKGLALAADLPKGCSSLEHVFFDESQLRKDGAYHCFVAAPRSLVTFAARGGLIHDRRQWVSSAAKYQSKTLEAMMFYETEDANDEGVYTAGLHKHFEKLRCFHFHVAKVEEAMKDPNFPGSDMRQAVAFLVQWLRDELPRSAEAIIFDCQWNPNGLEVDWNVIQLFDIVFASLVESGTPHNIKVAYFDRPLAYSSRGSYFPNSFEAGLRHGVNIHIQGSEHETTNEVSNRV